MVNDKEMLVNKLLLLYLIFKINEKSNFLGITKLQKFVYLIENKLYNDDKRALNYPFFRWNFGPMSKEVYTDREIMAKNSLITKDNINITRRGKEILSQCSEFFDNNKAIIEIVDEIVEKYSSYDTGELKNKVYNIEDISLNLKILDIPMAQDLLIDLFEKEEIVNIDDEWEETLDILLDEEAYTSVIGSFSDAQINKSIKYEGSLFV